MFLQNNATTIGVNPNKKYPHILAIFFRGCCLNAASNIKAEKRDKKYANPTFLTA
ncbi:hypothetical protein MKFW12EY_40700 [Methylomonas koyamae]|nr:hypothetical protein MKFW12EY_40700 [Methylomonas koyamae]